MQPDTRPSRGPMPCAGFQQFIIVIVMSMPEAYIARKDARSSLRLLRRARMLGSVSDPERIHEHERPRAPEHEPEPAEDPAGRCRTSSPTWATTHSAARSRYAGRGDHAERRGPPSVQSKIDSTRGSGAALDPGVAEQALAIARRPLRCPRAHRPTRTPQPRGLRAGVRDRQRRLLRQNEYKPNTSDGDQLIAHELAHVVQQRGAPTSGPLTVSNPGDAMENEADAVADKSRSG